MTAREGGNAIGLPGAALAFKTVLSNPIDSRLRDCESNPTSAVIDFQNHPRLAILFRFDIIAVNRM